MKKILLWTILLTALSLSPALGVEISGPKSTRPFREETYTVIASSEGTVTVTVSCADGIPEMTLVRDMPVTAGAAGFVWNGLLPNNEIPAKDSAARIAVAFRGKDGSRESTFLTVTIGNPLAAVTFATPRREAFYPLDGPLGIDFGCSLDDTTVRVEVASADEPGAVLKADTIKGTILPQTFYWNAKTEKGGRFKPGRYILTFYARSHPEYRSSFEVTVLEEPVPPPELSLTEAWQPKGTESNEEIWEMLLEPVAVIKGATGNGYRVTREPTKNSDVVGTVNCSLVGVRVLEILDRFVRIGFYRTEDARYTEGYVMLSDLEVIRPSAVYGLVLDKRTQELRVYRRGELLGILAVSTGLEQVSKNRCLTRAGVYLTGEFMKSFLRDGYWYNYPIRIDGPNLIHTSGMLRRKSGAVDYTEQIGALGVRASHGCVRVDPRADTDTGLNMYYLYTHLAKYTKIIVIENEAEHEYGAETAGFEVKDE